MKNSSGKRRGKLQLKLILVVLLVTALSIGFLLLVVRDVYEGARRREIENIQTQVSKTAQQIADIQRTLENLSRLIVYNEVVQSRIADQNTSPGQALFAARSINNTLMEYLHIIDGIDEITIYTADGRTFTSRYVRGDFDPENADWFRAFLESGKNSGYTGVHRSIPWQSGYNIDVISYITNYYSISNVSDKLGELIISLDFGVFRRVVQLDNTLLSGYCLLDGDDEALIANGVLGDGQSNADSGSVVAGRDGVIVSSRDMLDGWRLVAEISTRELMRRAMRSMQDMLLLLLALLILSMLLLWNFIRRIVSPINQLSEAAQAVGRGDLSVRVDVRTRDEIEDLADAFNKMVVDIDTLLRRSVEHEQKLRQMQTENLMLQINPHFIYNTMNSIVYMARMDGNRQIADFTNAFISLLQSTLRVRSSVYSTLGEELGIVKNYLYLQEYRYANKFTYDIQCPEELRQCRILSVILQPVVENAIFHGVAPKDGPGHIGIAVKEAGGALEITVEDDGVGITQAQLVDIENEDYARSSGIHRIGIGNVRKRIEEIYGSPYTMRIESAVARWTRVTIRIPKRLPEETEPDENREEEGLNHDEG